MFVTSELSVLVSVFAVFIMFPLESNAFQLTDGFSTRVLIPNFTLSPGWIESSVVKIITPWGVFFPIQPFSVLKDWNEFPSPNQILTESISVLFPLLFLNSKTVEFSNPILLTIISFSAYAI